MSFNFKGRFKIHIFSLFIIFSPIVLCAQNYNVKTFTTKDGLAHNNVRTIAEDSTGFLWIGTYDGLSRYDGYQFKNYFHIPGDTTSLSYFSVRKLLVDKNNNLWILTDRSEIILYNRISDNFKRILGFSDKNQKQIYNIGLDKENDLWIIANNEILRRDIETGVFTSFNVINKKGESIPLENVSFWDVCFSGNNTVWLIGSNVYELEVNNSNLSEGNLIIKNIFNLESSFLHERMDFEVFLSFSLYESPAGNCWLFSNIGLFKLDNNKSAFCEFRGDINNKEFTGNRKFDWIWNKEGLFSYDQVTHRTNIYRSEKCQFYNSFLNQEKKIMWVSGLSSSGEPTGLLQIVFTNSFFKNYLIGNKGSDMPAVYSIVKDQNNNLWLGIKGKDHIVQVTQNNRIKKTGQLAPGLFKSTGHIRSMLRVKDGIWIGYISNLLEFYNFKNGKFTRHYPKEEVFRTLAVNKDGNVFIGNENLSLYHPASGKTELLWKGKEKIYDLFLDENNILWGGITTKELLMYNTITKEAIKYSISSEVYHIEDICSGENNDLWLATLGEGLCNFYPESGKTIYYTTSTGLSNNTTYSILKDKTGNLWISTDNGISCLNPETGKIRIFNRTDGIGITEFNSDASYEADDGEFFFGGMGGLVGFYPDSLPETTKDINEFRILLTDFVVAGEKKSLPEALNESNTITLSKGETNFQLSFSSTDFLNSDKTLFRYRLNKVNTGWIGTNSHNRSVNYSNLKPGSYLFEIQATNINGEWKADKKIAFLITPYFYQTWLFRITVPLFIIFVLAGIIIVYIRQLKQKEKQKQDALKLQSLQGQMNPHFIFNSLNSINYFISNNDKLSANRYIADFSRLIRSILSNLGSDYIPFTNEVNFIKDYLNIEYLRFGDKFDFEFNIDRECENSDFDIFPGLVQPFIENAIWHGVRALELRKGFIKVSFSSVELNRIRCTVEDDGIGWETSLNRKTDHENHKSRGINIVKERLQLISKLQGVNYHLEISDLYPDRKDTGTKVEIDIPVKSIKTSIK